MIDSDHPIDAIGAVAETLARHPDARVRLHAARLFAVRDELTGTRPEASLHERDEHFRAAAEHFTDLAPAQRVKAEVRALYRYHAAGWRRDRAKADNPHPPGSLRASFWLALKAVDRPIGEKQMRRILRPLTR